MKILDTEHGYHGYLAAPGVCRIQVYTLEGEPPLIVACELLKNPGTSVTNMAEYLAAEVVERYLSSDMLASGDTPFLWLEVYERADEDRRAGLSPARARVLFEHYRRERTHRVVPGMRFRFGQPDWSHIDRRAFERIIRRYGGDDADVAIADIPGLEGV